MIPLPSMSNATAWFAQIAIVTAVAAVLPALLGLRAPGIRYAYWRGTLLLCLALPWLQGRVATPAAPVTTPAAGGAAVSAAAVASPPAAAAGAIDWLTVIVLIVAAGAAIRLAWMAVGVVRLRRLRHSGETIASCEEIDELATIIGAAADVRYVAGITHPVTFGALRPVVLLPDSLRERSSDIRRAVLAHELLHVQRRDWAWLVAEESIRALFWFHPAMWWLVNRVQLAREEVVDELAVTVTGRRRAYVEALLAFADRVPAAASAFARQRHLFRRMVLISREVAMSSTRIAASSLLMALLVIGSAVYASNAFPLAGSASAQVSPSQASSLEQRANRVTPENPIPRRISHVEVPASQEADAMGMRGTITLLITVDSAGMVAEARPVGLSLRATNPSINVSFDSALWTRVQDMLRTQAGRSRVPEVVDALVSDAIAAVKQWRYDPPYQAPLAFTVSMRFGAPPPPPPPPSEPALRTRSGIPPPPPPAPVDPAFQLESDGTLRVGGNIKAPTKIRDVRPIYPALAQAARVQGVVIVEARIEPDGSVSRARVLRSIPLLDQAALDAVQQWQFTPTLLNGNPIPVIMTLTVNFSLE